MKCQYVRIFALIFTALFFVACDNKGNPTINEDNDVNLNSSSSEEAPENSSSSQEVPESSSSEESGDCKVVPICDAIVMDDFSTWNFIKDDAFGDEMEYIYTVDGKSLILTTIDANGTKKVNSNAYAMYDMTTAVSQDMSFRAVVSTCKGDNGNPRTKKVCE
ncbi:MAG: hypothetical protein GX116_04085 [Fibrobacter sp.]|nr:hypothetical protein [Fibrobacter sp.]